MAEAEKTVKKVARTVYDETEVILLELTKEEAIFLKACMAKVSGAPEGLRGIADSISNALFPVVGHRYFNRDSWFRNEYYRDGKRCGYSFDDDTSVEKNIVKDTYSW